MLRTSFVCAGKERSLMKNSGTVRMETKRLVLRPFVIEDAGAMFRNWANDPHEVPHLGTSQGCGGDKENSGGMD